MTFIHCTKYKESYLKYGKTWWFKNETVSARKKMKAPNKKHVSRTFGITLSRICNAAATCRESLPQRCERPYNVFRQNSKNKTIYTKQSDQTELDKLAKSGHIIAGYCIPRHQQSLQTVRNSYVKGLHTFHTIPGMNKM